MIFFRPNIANFHKVKLLVLLELGYYQRASLFQGFKVCILQLQIQLENGFGPYCAVSLSISLDFNAQIIVVMTQGD